MSQDQFSDEKKRDIVNRLNQKGVCLECPMCRQRQFVLADGYFNHPIQQDLEGGFTIGGPSVPTVAIVCKNCGFMSQHAVGALGLLPTQKEEMKK